METHFKKYVPMTVDTKLVLIDGHKSHINLTLAEWGRSNNIVSWADPEGGTGGPDPSPPLKNHKNI